MVNLPKLLSIVCLAIAATSLSAWADEWPTETARVAQQPREFRSSPTTARQIVLSQLKINLVLGMPKDGKAELNTIINHPGERDKSKPESGVYLRVDGQNIAQTGESISAGNGVWSHHQFFSLDSKRKWPPSIVLTYKSESAVVDFKTPNNPENKAIKSVANVPGHTSSVSVSNKMADQANRMATVENPYKKGSSASVIAERRGDLAAKNGQASDHP